MISIALRRTDAVVYENSNDGGEKKDLAGRFARRLFFRAIGREYSLNLYGRKGRGKKVDVREIGKVYIHILVYTSRARIRNTMIYARHNSRGSHDPCRHRSFSQKPSNTLSRALRRATRPPLPQTNTPNKSNTFDTAPRSREYCSVYAYFTRRRVRTFHIYYARFLILFTPTTTTYSVSFSAAPASVQRTYTYTQYQTLLLFYEDGRRNTP